jgi:hypothetical protein
VVRVNVRNLVFCFVAITVLLATSGCYTVLQKRTLDGKPPVEIVSQASVEFSGDLAFRDCTHGRWSHYLLRPWWEESVFKRGLWPERKADSLGRVQEDVADEEEVVEVAPAPEAPRPYISSKEFIREIPSASSPNSTPDAPDTRHKTAGSQQTESKESGSKETTKPTRQNGPGGKR